MRRFSGLGGALYFVSEPLRFEVALKDCGEGFDWRSSNPSLSYWLPDSPVTVAAWTDREWRDVEVRDVAHAGGRVSLARCLRGQTLRATGMCLPLALAGEAERWLLDLSSTTADTSTFETEEDKESRTVVGHGAGVLAGFRAELGAPELDGSLMLARLPLGNGWLTGVGRLADTTAPQVRIRFEKGSVHYAH